jgi:hypothetical protein
VGDDGRKARKAGALKWEMPSRDKLYNPEKGERTES